MRLSDGEIRESIFGLIISLKSDTYSENYFLSWDMLFLAANNSLLMNQIIKAKIDDCQQRLSHWQRLKEKADAKKEQENSEK